MASKFDVEQALRRDPELLAGLVEDADQRPPVKADETTVRGRIRRLLVRKKTKDGEGAPLSTLAKNVETVLRNDPDFANDIWKDMWSQELMWGDREYRDTESTKVRVRIFDLYGFEPPKSLVDEVVAKVAEEHGKNPLTDWLDGLEWDGVPRIDSYLVRAIGCDDVKIHRQMSRKWLIAAIARALRPGCKMDTALILSGGQGALKSQSFERLAGEDYFVDTALEIGDRRGYLQLQKAWIYELAELDSIRRRENTQVKSFMASRFDTFVPPYGRHTVRIRRHCVMCGTTNKVQFLNDPTGSRRYWPVRVGVIDLDWIEDNRDQIWAEAVVAFKAGEKWWFGSEGEMALQDASESFQEVDPWVEVVETHMRRHAASGQTISDILQDALHLKTNEMTRLIEMRVSDILQGLGYEKFRGSKRGRRAYLWRKEADVVEIDTATTRKTGA